MTNKECRETVVTWIFGFVSGLCVMGLIASVRSRPEIVEIDGPVNDLWVTREMRVTAYCPGKCCCGKWADGITASGHMIQSGDYFVAAPKAFPFGTIVIIPGYPLAGQAGEEVEVEDRGGAIKDDRLVVFFPTHREALNWGVQILNVEIKL